MPPLIEEILPEEASQKQTGYGEHLPYYNTADWDSGSYSWDAENGTRVTEHTTYVDIQWIDVAALKSSTGVAHIVWSAKEDSEDDYEIYWERITFD